MYKPSPFLVEAAHKTKVDMLKRLGSTFYYSTDNATWYITLAPSIGLTGRAITLPANATDLTAATDATGYTRAGRPNAGAYEAR